MTRDIPWKQLPIHEGRRITASVPVVRLRELSQAQRRQLYRAARSGAVAVVRPGVMAPTTEWSALSEHDRYRVRVQETLAVIGARAVVSHESAAMMHGIPLLGQYGDRIHVVRPRERGVVHGREVVYHSATRPPGTVQLGGMWVTDPARTVADLARSGGFARGLVAADYVLAQGLATRTELEEEIQKLAFTAGVGTARLVAERADPLSESPGESLTRARLFLIGAPIPELQVTVMVDGKFYRVDFLWRKQGIVGEFDGALKYAGTAAAAAGTVQREKLREDALRRKFGTVIRFTWDDVLRVDPFEAELRRVGLLSGVPVRDGRFL